MSKYVLGRNAKLFYNESGSWAEVKCRDLTVTLNKPEIDTSERGQDWATSAGGMKKASLTTQMMVKTGTDKSGAFEAFQDSFENDTPVEVLVLTGANESPNWGYYGSVVCIDFSISQPLQDVQLVDLTLTFDGTYEPEQVTCPADDPAGS